MSKRTVLCVSDEIPNRHSVADLFKRAGYDVAAVCPDQAAVFLAVNRRVDAVVVEQHKEERSESPLTAQLRSIRPDLPILQVPPGRRSRETCFKRGFTSEATFETIPRTLELMMEEIAA